jgi:hypothetical protein
VKVSADVNRGLWLLLAAVHCVCTIRMALDGLRDAKSDSTRRYVASARESVTFWIQATRDWLTIWAHETCTQEARA